MKNLSNNRYNKERSNNDCGFSVEVNLKVNTAGLVKSLELIHLGTSDCGSHTRATSRTFASANHSALTNSHSFNFIGMNSSTVISARGLSREGMDFSSGSGVNDVHGVSGINFLHLMPSNFEALQRVNDQKPLIKEDNFGMNKDQVKQGAGEKTPEQRAQSRVKSVIDDVDVNQSADGKEGAKTHYITTAGSKGFEVAHLAILSRQERRAA